MNLAAKTTKKSQNSAFCGGFFLEIIVQNHHCPQNPRNSMFSRRQWWFSKVLTEQKPPLGIKPSPWTYDCALYCSTYRLRTPIRSWRQCGLKSSACHTRTARAHRFLIQSVEPWDLRLCLVSLDLPLPSYSDELLLADSG